MSEIGDLMKKREKEKIVFDTRQKEAVNTEENAYKVAPKEEYRPANNIQVDYEKQRLDGATSKNVSSQSETDRMIRG